MLPRIQQDHNHGNVFVTLLKTVVMDTVNLQMDHVIHLIAHMIRRNGFMFHENFASSNSWPIEARPPCHNEG